jgi:broad specificity phosphatase PhoE
MKIYILRHEERNIEDATFCSPLTPNGFNNSKKLATTLKEYNMTHIFTSPFLRTLQTIEKYCKIENTKAYREFALYEFMDSCIGTPNNYLFDVPNEYQSIIDLSFYKMEDIQWNDSFDIIKKRVQSFIEYLQKSNFIKDKENANILLVTHMSIVNALLNKESEDYYPMGHITLLS